MNRGSLRTQQRETVRAQILDAAEELIATRGPGAPLIEIAKQAGVAVGTLYNYFVDRDALIAGLFEQRRSTLRPMIADAIKATRGLPFEPRLRALVRGLFAAFDSHRRFIRVVIETEHVKLVPAPTVADYQTAIDDAVAAGAKEGAIAVAQRDRVAFMIGGAIRNLVLRRIADGVPFAADADPLVDLLLDGVRRRK